MYSHWELTISLVIAVAAMTISTYANSETCSSYAGGNVYPSTTFGKGHELYYSKVQISKPAPDFTATGIVNGQIREVKLKDYSGKYLIIVFYPADFTFVCPTEILAFNDRLEEFKKIGAEVVAMSVDSHFVHLAWIQTPRDKGGLGDVKLPLLSDPTHQISKDYGVYLEELGHTLRGLFIIDTRGTLRQITMNDLPVGRSVDETLRLVQAFQYTDTHADVCPSGWKPGQATIIPDPKDKLKYFSEVNPQSSAAE
ncbi:peroxiredoxin-2-like [Symsagittifera roscoffensis]|uniref:peroxiredoxin-2-like n=1 Tax=Symsagittifera roscoffensis TaxID=84072 RepID=UPI00307B69FE